jgi:hypothetical protein
MMAISSRRTQLSEGVDAMTRLPHLTPMRLLIAALLGLILCEAGHAASLAGQNIQPGGKIEIRFAVPSYFQNIAADGGNPRPDTGRAVLTFPAGFDPGRTWPILIVTSTSDFNRTSAMDADWYRPAATSEGWIVLGPDATISPRIDSTQWRLGILGAALEVIRKEWPQSARWPVAFAGFSGGSKRSGVLGAMLAKTGSVRLCGFFLSGINEDRLGEAYRTYHPGGSFLDTPIWLSSGANDPVATPQAHNLVKASLERSGFKRVRLEQFGGGHQLKLSEVRRALQWFRQLGRF